MKIKNRTIDNSFFQNVSWEEVSCRLCDSRRTKLLSRRDCLGLPVHTALCQRCGLIYINPRPSKEWYRMFYSSLGGGHHKYKQSSFTGDEKPIGFGFDQARKHGRALALRLGKYMKPGVTVDVGSSEGGVLAGMRDVLDIQPIGIEPITAEAEYASSRGIPTHAALIENIESLGIALPSAANIVCVKSLNHFLNPAYFFSWAWQRLENGGRLILEVKNFRHQCRRSGRIHIGIQLDHPYMYVPEILSAFAEQAGFDVLFLDVDEIKSHKELDMQKQMGLPAGHIRIAAKKSEREPFSFPFRERPEIVSAIASAFRPLNLYFYYFMKYANIRKNILARF